MTRLTLEVDATGASISAFAARVAPATARALGVDWSSFALLRRRDHELPVAAFRLEVDGDVPLDVVRINQWPAEAAPTPAEVSVVCVAPAFVRTVQCLELAPTSPDQPRLARAFLKRLVRGRVLLGARGVVTIHSDSIDYGRWRFVAHCRSQAAGLPLSPEQQPLVREMRVVTDHTLVLLLPAGATGAPLDAEYQRFQPIGAHGESFREFVAMALTPSPVAGAGRNRQEEERVAPARSVLVQGPSGAGKTTLVRLVAAQLGAALLTGDCSVLTTRHVQLEDLVAAAVRVQPTVLVLEDLELLFPRVLDEAKYKLASRLVSCVDAIRTFNSIVLASGTGRWEAMKAASVLTWEQYGVGLAPSFLRQDAVGARRGRGYRHVTECAAQPRAPALCGRSRTSGVYTTDDRRQVASVLGTSVTHTMSLSSFSLSLTCA